MAVSAAVGAGIATGVWLDVGISVGTGVGSGVGTCVTSNDAIPAKSSGLVLLLRVHVRLDVTWKDDVSVNHKVTA